LLFNTKLERSRAIGNSKIGSLRADGVRSYEYHFRSINSKETLLGEEIDSEYLSYEINRSTYYFCEFRKLLILASGAHTQDGYLVVENAFYNYCDFNDCKIDNVKFINSRF